MREPGSVVILAVCYVWLLAVCCLWLSAVCCVRLSPVPHGELQPLRKGTAMLYAGPLPVASSSAVAGGVAEVPVTPVER